MLVFGHLSSSRRGWPCHERRVAPALFASPQPHRLVVKFEACAWQVTQTYTMRLLVASHQEFAGRCYRWRAASLDDCRRVRVHSGVPQMLGCSASGLEILQGASKHRASLSQGQIVASIQTCQIDGSKQLSRSVCCNPSVASPLLPERSHTFLTNPMVGCSSLL